jgi:hypothetical protein
LSDVCIPLNNLVVTDFLSGELTAVGYPGRPIDGTLRTRASMAAIRHAVNDG